MSGLFVNPVQDHFPYEPTVPSSVVGYEYIGLARALRRRVAKEHRAFRDEAVALLAPFQAGRSFAPSAQRLLLRRLAFQWQHHLPAGSRVACRVDLDRANRLEIVEIRFRELRLRLPFWTTEESGISIERLTFRVLPPIFETEEGLVIAGLHSLARRYQRGSDRTDAAVLRDIAKLVQAYPRVASVRRQAMRARCRR